MENLYKEILYIKMKEHQTQEDKEKIQKLQQEIDFLQKKSEKKIMDLPDMGYMEWLEYKEKENEKKI
jgi:hypothetical protein